MGSIALTLIRVSRRHGTVDGELRLAPASAVAAPMVAAPVVAVPIESLPSAPSNAPVGRMIDDVA